MAQDIRQRIVINAQDRTAAATRSARRNLTTLEGGFKRLENTFIGFAGLDLLTRISSSLIKMSDTAIDMNGKLKLVTDSTEEFNKAQADLLKISLDNGAQLEANSILYTRINKPLKDLNFSLDQTSDFTRAVAEGLRISGAGAQESSATIRQLSQAIMSGVLRGEELNSVMEQGGRITEALAAGLGVSTGALRKMGAEGELTSEKVVTAILSQSDAISKEAREMPLTIARSMENIKSQTINFLAHNTDVNQSLAKMAQSAATNFDEIATVAIPAVIVAFSMLGAGLAKMIAMKVRASIAAGQLAKAERLAAIEEGRRAAAAERFAERRLANAAKELAAETRLASYQSIRHTTRTREAIATNQANITRLNGIKAQITYEIRLAEMAIVAETNAARKIVLQGQLNVLMARATANTQQLTAAGVRLTASNNALTASMAAQTTAFNANAVAQQRANLASSAMVNGYTRDSTRIQQLAQNNINRSAGWGGAVMSNVNAVGTGTLSMLGKVGAALMGWPGLMALVAVQFVDLELATWAWGRTLGRAAVVMSNLWSAVFSPSDYKAAIDQFDKETIDQSDRMIARRQAQSEGFATIAAKERADKKIHDEQQLKIAESNKRRLLATTNAVQIAEDKRHAIVVENLRIHSKLMRNTDEEHEAGLKARIESIKANATLEMAIESTTALSYAEKQANKVAVTKRVNGEVLAAQTKDYAERRGMWDTYFTSVLIGLEKNSKSYLTISQAHQAKLAELDKKTVRSLSSAINEMSTIRDKHLQSVSTGIEYIRTLERDAAQFSRELNSDSMSDYQKSADAQARITEAQARLREADALDSVKQAAEQKKIRDEVMSDLKEIASDEKSRADDLEKYSVEELSASANKQSAFDLYNETVQVSIEARKDLNKVELAEAERLKGVILQRNESLKEYEAAIMAADELVLKQRELLITADTTKAEQKIRSLVADIAKLNNGVVDISTQFSEAQLKGSSESEPRDWDEYFEKFTGLADAGSGRNTIARNAGGTVPGTGDTDTVPAMLTPGEFVINKDAVKALENDHGADALYKLNNGMLPILRNAGGTVNQETIDNRITSINNSINTTREATRGNQVSTGESYLGNAAQAQGSSWQDDYFSALSTAASSLDGKDFNSVAGIGRIIDNGLNILERSTTRNRYDQYMADVSAMQGIMAELDNAVSSASDYVEPSVETATTTSTAANVDTDETDTGVKTVGKYGHVQLEKSEAKILEQARIDGATGRSLIPNYNLLTNELDTVANAVAANSTIPASPGKQTLPSQGEPSIVIELKISDNVSATGSFVDNDATRIMLAELKQKGLVNAK